MLTYCKVLRSLHTVRNFRMRFVPKISSCPIKMLAKMQKRRKFYLIFYDGQKFRRQCVNVIDTTFKHTKLRTRILYSVLQITKHLVSFTNKHTSCVLTQKLQQIQKQMCITSVNAFQFDLNLDLINLATRLNMPSCLLYSKWKAVWMSKKQNVWMCTIHTIGETPPTNI